jgi:hypothetical protein
MKIAKNRKQTSSRINEQSGVNHITRKHKHEKNSSIYHDGMKCFTFLVKIAKVI